MENFTLLKRAITNQQLDSLPEEAFSEAELIILLNGKHQTRRLTVKPTVRSIASEILSTRPELEHGPIKLALQNIIQAPDIDEAQFELLLFKARTKAKWNIVKKIEAIYSTGNPEDAEQLELRLYELNQQKQDQLQKPINAEQWDKLEKAEQDEIMIGIDWLQENNVPFKKKVLYAFIATTNGGKTIIKTWFAIMFMKAGQNILYLSQEEPREDTIRRVYQTCLGLTEQEYAERTQDGFEELGKQFIEMSQQKGWGKFFAVEWPNIKISHLKKRIKEFKQDHDVELDACFIDYGKLVDIDTRSNQEWERIGTIFKEFKGMAMELNICVITSIQLNRESSMALNREGTTPDLTSVAGAFEATHHANYIWSVKLQYNEVEGTRTANTALGTFILTVQKQKYGMLRQGDSKAFTWTADHMLVENNNYNTAPEITLGID